MGKRFGALTRITNKSLFPVEGKPLLTHLIQRLSAAGIRDTYVITGHQHDQLNKVLKKTARAVYNPFYKETGILGSFWAAKPYLDGKSFLFTTSDHFFHPEVLRDLLRISRGTDLCVVVQKKKAYTKEDSKVTIKNFRVAEMGKTIPVHQADGEFGGMAYFSARASARFFAELENRFAAHRFHDYMMEIMTFISAKYTMPIYYSLCEENSRIEVDSVHDLIQARQMAKKFKTTTAYERKHR